MRLQDLDAKMPYLLDGKYAVEPIRRGKWIVKPFGIDNLKDYTCSICGKIMCACDVTPQYCPFCGAKMGEDE